MYEVYCITNTINNKKYIGITTQGIKERFRKHCNEAHNGSSRYLCKAIRKYGEEVFSVERVCYCEDMDQLLEKEIFYISNFNTFGSGYNLTKGGEGSLGRKQTKITKCKISEKRKGFKYSQEQKEHFKIKGKEVSYWKGKKMTKEAREKMSESKKGKKLSEETKQKRKYIYEKNKGENHPLYNVGHSDCTKEKISKSKKGQGTKKYIAYNKSEKIEFKSLKDALVFLDIKGHSGILKSVKEKTLYKNYYWTN